MVEWSLIIYCGIITFFSRGYTFGVPNLPCGPQQFLINLLVNIVIILISIQSDRSLTEILSINRFNPLLHRYTSDLEGKSTAWCKTIVTPSHL